MSRTLSGLFLVGANNRPRKRKRTNRENPRRVPGQIGKIPGKVPKGHKRTKKEGQVQIGKPPRSKPPRLAALLNCGIPPLFLFAVVWGLYGVYPSFRTYGVYQEQTTAPNSRGGRGVTERGGNGSENFSALLSTFLAIFNKKSYSKNLWNPLKISQNLSERFRAVTPLSVTPLPFSDQRWGEFRSDPVCAAPVQNHRILDAQILRSRPPFTGVLRGPGWKVPPGVLFECFWAPASECPKECFLSACWRF